ncbi:hypothetical protein N656DRAFT_57313 [Canariomyces notabilis]|uniref:Uncharacterized protein n=1 Tax=Canariomyces notabilis TaxID=2074819 RepID=A0AAN6YXG9_9PEZI|nr:hypothetical protein N656DRAFT_57313 [Canariomyces arenarius]
MPVPFLPGPVSDEQSTRWRRCATTSLRCSQILPTCLVCQLLLCYRPVRPSRSSYCDARFPCLAHMAPAGLPRWTDCICLLPHVKDSGRDARLPMQCSNGDLPEWQNTWICRPH